MFVGEEPEREVSDHEWLARVSSFEFLFPLVYYYNVTHIAMILKRNFDIQSWNTDRQKFTYMLSLFKANTLYDILLKRRPPKL